MINIEKLSKFYGKDDYEQEVLKNISLHINKGEMVSVMGPSGSGKSTMLNILGLLDKNYEGKYIIDGIEVSCLNEKERAFLRSKKIGFIFQGFHLLRDLSALENVKMGLIIANICKNKNEKLSKSEMVKKSRELLERMGLEKYIDKQVCKLSGGQQQRVAIARALINNPEVILADEPTGALDQSTGKDIMEILKELNKEGRTIIIVTHDEKVASYCDKKVYMLDGKLGENIGEKG